MKILATIIGILLASSSFVQAQQDCDPNPPNGMAPLAAYSIFQGNYKNGDYPFALDYARWMMCSNPESIEGYPRFDLGVQYTKFIKIYTEIAKSKEDPSEQEAYIDSALTLFDKSFELFVENDQDRYELLQKRGRYFLENYQNIEGGLQKAYGDFEAMFEIDPEQTTELADGYYIKVTVDNMVRQDRKDEVIKIIETATPYADASIQQFFEETLNSVFDSPEERLTFCQEKLEADPNSLEDLKCVAEAQEDLDMLDELEQTLRKIHQLEPTFDSALKLADIEKGNANYADAAKFYKEALALASTDQQMKEINIDLSDVHASMGQLQNAKKYILDALKVDGNYGLAYIKLASIYGQAVSKCTESRKLEAKDKVVYWVVVDFLKRAKNVDPSVTNTVNNQLATYEAVTPSTEDKFFTLGFEDGQKVKVDASLMSCYSWINETTTVR
jgi:tetratricopeptide (TPR) repeat protein